MKTQISRDSHRPEQRYSAVFQQMGRMLTDADWNEFATLNRDRLADVLFDVIGSGSPRQRGIVQQTLTADGRDAYQLHWGYVYVEGVRAQLRPAADAVLSDAAGVLFEYAQQADFPAAPVLPATPYKLYLDVWERSVTALEDNQLRDPGLHGADTCTRSQTMAQVKWCAPEVDPCDRAINPTHGNALLSLTLRQGNSDPDPCDPCADEITLQDAVGNYLYRVEIHDVTYAADGSPDSVVLKWSVENGAEQYAVDNPPPDFAAADWAYEFFDGPDQQFASEKHLGRHLAPGFNPIRGQLTTAYPDPVPAGFNHVRRWDGFCELKKTAGNWLLENGSDRGVGLSTASAVAAQGHVDEGATISLVLNTVILDIDLSDHQLLAGDRWLAPVRETVNHSGDVLLDQVIATGIRHHYLCLGIVNDGRLTPDPEALCKTFRFPALTDLQADDVCYDNSICQVPGVRTVRDALDHLCQNRDLRQHNQHLHGWGIVCGLTVECVPVPRSNPPGERPGSVQGKPGLARDIPDPVEDQPGPERDAPGPVRGTADLIGDAPPPQLLTAADRVRAKGRTGPDAKRAIEAPPGIAPGLGGLPDRLDLDDIRPFPDVDFVLPDQTETVVDDVLQRRQLRLKEGYALDCEGNDIVVNADQTIDLIEAIDIQREAGVEGLPPADGQGSVCLVLEHDDNGQAQVKVEPYVAELQGLEQWLDGSLLSDLLNDCVDPLLSELGLEFDLLKGEFNQAADTSDTRLVPRQRREWLGFNNLLVQLFNHDNGRFVHLSLMDHAILGRVYNRLRQLLKSKTFCGLFTDARLPNYPFVGRQAITWFGKNNHRRMLLHPDGQFLYTYAGNDNTINVYNTSNGEMIEELVMPINVNTVVSALVVDAQNEVLYVTASNGAGDTVFSRARINNDGHIWTGSQLFNDVQLSALELNANRANSLFAIGRGLGLFEINTALAFPADLGQQPGDVSGIARPLAAGNATNRSSAAAASARRFNPVNRLYTFNAFGHLAIDDGSGEAFATVIDGQRNDPDRYHQIAVMNIAELPGTTEPPQQLFQLYCENTDIGCAGEDGIAIKPVDEQGANGQLYVAVNGINSRGPKQILGYPWPLQSDLPTASESVNVERTTIALAYHARNDCLLLAMEDSHRLQSITADADESKVSRIPVQIQPSDITVDPRIGRVYALNSGSNTVTMLPAEELVVDNEYLQQLQEYRTEMLQAFYGLAGGLLQYLKDCLCDHLLVNCPSCDDDDKIYLACVEVRDNQVHNICHFSKRKSVHSFPSVERWLSLVPIVPIVTGWLSKICCTIVPDLFKQRRDTVIPPDSPDFNDSVIDNSFLISGFTAGQVRQSVQAVGDLRWSSLFGQQGRHIGLYGKLLKDCLLGNTTNNGLDPRDLSQTPVSAAIEQLNARQIVFTLLPYLESQACHYLHQTLATPSSIPLGSRVNVYHQNQQVVLVTLAQQPIADAAGQAVDQQQNDALASTQAEMDAIKTQLADLQQRVVALTPIDDGVVLNPVNSLPVTAVSGVGPAMERILSTVDISDVGQLAQATSADLTRAEGISQTQADKLIKAAQVRLRKFDEKKGES